MFSSLMSSCPSFSTMQAMWAAATPSLGSRGSLGSRPHHPSACGTYSPTDGT